MDTERRGFLSRGAGLGQVTGHSPKELPDRVQDKTATPGEKLNFQGSRNSSEHEGPQTSGPCPTPPRYRTACPSILSSHTEGPSARARGWSCSLPPLPLSKSIGVLSFFPPSFVRLPLAPHTALVPWRC